jgi:hypothetical protein
MQLHRHSQDLSAKPLAWLRQLLRAPRAKVPSFDSRPTPRKLTPIDEILARVGRDPVTLD